MGRARPGNDDPGGDGLVLPLSGGLPCFGHYRGTAVVLLSQVAYRALTARADRRAGAGRLIVTRFDRDRELRAFVLERLGKVSQSAIRAEAVEKFGAERAPSRSALARFVGRWKRDGARP